MASRFRAPSSRERVPHLVLRFAVIAALGLAVAAVVIVALLRQAYAVQGEQRAVARARLITDTLQGQLRRSDFAQPVAQARRRQLTRVFSGAALSGGQTEAVLYSDRATPTYFSGLAPVADRTIVRRALAGNVISSVGSSRSGSGRVLTTYVPVVIGRGGVRGVVALEQDYAPIAAATRHSALVVAGILEGLLVALCALLLPMLARASTRIRTQIDALDRIATHDELTGLANRAGFRRTLEHLPQVAPASAAVMLVDLERFHEINDALGPERADGLLVEVAARLQALDPAMFVARLGEDVFGLLLTGADDPMAIRCAQQIRLALGVPFNVEQQRIALEARIGCALFPRDGTEPAVLLRRAGVALSLAKESRAAVEIYDAHHDASDISRLALTTELRDALTNRELTIHYQPQADLASGAIRGVEALVRWQHPRRGLLTAAEFIPAAERAGLIGEIGRFVLETSARQWRQWRLLGITLDMAVNLSAVDLLDPQLPDDIEALIAEHGLPPEYLVLEITERTLLRDDYLVRQTLDRLHRIGARLAVDDYGTGYSSLAHVRNLRAQQIKLDRTFTAGVTNDRASEAIVRSTIELAHTLGATVVAEGVETPDQWTHLAGLGCDIAQGYLIGRPVAADELTGLVNTRPALRIVA